MEHLLVAKRRDAPYSSSMKSIQRVLAIVVADKSIERIADAAAQFAAKGAQVEFLHFEPKADAFGPMLYPNYAQAVQKLKDTYDENIEKEMLAEISKHIPETDFRLFSSSAEGLDELKDRVKSFDADLIIVPSFNEEFDSFVSGSVVEKLIRYSQVPVLVLRNQLELSGAQIATAVAFQGFSARSLQMTQELCTKFGCKSHLLHVRDLFEGAPTSLSQLKLSEKEAAAWETMKAVFESLQSDGLIFSESIFDSQSSAKETLLRQLKKIDPPLVIMGSSGRQGLQHFFLGSFCEFIFHNTQMNLLIAKS